MSGMVKVMDGHIGEISKFHDTKVNFTWRHVEEESINFRAGLIAHEEAVMNAALFATPGSDEQAKFIQQYRFLREYRKVDTKPVDSAAREYLLKKHKAQIDQESIPAFERLFSTETREKIAKLFQ